MTFEEKYEKLELGVKEINDNLLDLNKELNKLNCELVIYNNHLEIHIKRTEANEKRLEFIEEKFIKLTEKQIDSEKEIQKFNTVSITIMKVFIGIGGVFGFIWIIMQILGKMGL